MWMWMRRCAQVEQRVSLISPKADQLQPRGSAATAINRWPVELTSTRPDMPSRRGSSTSGRRPGRRGRRQLSIGFVGAGVARGEGSV